MISTRFADSRVLTQEVLAFIEGLRVAWDVPGLSVGVVRLDEGIEVRGLGVMSNDGDKVTPDVNFEDLFEGNSDGKFSSDAVWHRILHKGIHGHGGWNFDQ
jgi:hypothetical protein